MDKLKTGLERLKEAHDLCESPGADGILWIEDVLKKILEAIGLARGYVFHRNVPNESKEEGAEQGQPQEEEKKDDEDKKAEEYTDDTDLKSVKEEYVALRDVLLKKVSTVYIGRAGKRNETLTVTDLNGLYKVILAVVNKIIDMIDGFMIME